MDHLSVTLLVADTITQHNDNYKAYAYVQNCRLPIKIMTADAGLCRSKPVLTSTSAYAEIVHKNTGL